MSSFANFHPALEQLGFTQAGPDTWGRVHGDLTLFIEGGDMAAADDGSVVDRLTAWLLDATTSQYAGPVLEIIGPTQAALDKAMSQFECLLHEEELSPLARHDARVLEAISLC